MLYVRARARVTQSLNESPSEKEGKWLRQKAISPSPLSLNESPSEKEGKSRCISGT